MENTSNKMQSGETARQTDVLVIGAGPTGLFAVFECGMLGMRCHVIDALAEIGGQCTALYPEKPIYDIPAHPDILAGDLIAKLEAQAAPFAPVYHLGEQAEKLERLESGRLRVTTSKGTVIEATAIIVAAGAGAFGPNRPPLEGIEAFENKSVFYMVKRRADFTGKRVVIAGGGDSAVDWTISLADVAEKIYVVHRRDKFRAADASVEKLKSLAAAPDSRIEMVIPYQLHALHGADGMISGVDVADMDGAVRSIKADALLAFFGLTPQLGPLAEWGLDIAHFHIPVAQDTCESAAARIFAVGDVATYPRKLKLILTGFAEAAQAAHAIHPLVFPGQELHFTYSTSKGKP
ncbi:MAG TPA: NAD(P)/FAD-dependent oxidoreductase [Alphaproteobacteria bacterium]|nr:NAD(P)/FAD-dependent oxidoreductase [Alphaproteobacteria bacterium]